MTKTHGYISSWKCWWNDSRKALKNVRKWFVRIEYNRQQFDHMLRRHPEGPEMLQVAIWTWLGRRNLIFSNKKTYEHIGPLLSLHLQFWIRIVFLFLKWKQQKLTNNVTKTVSVERCLKLNRIHRIHTRK